MGSVASQPQPDYSALAALTPAELQSLQQLSPYEQSVLRELTSLGYNKEGIGQLYQDNNTLTLGGSERPGYTNPGYSISGGWWNPDTQQIEGAGQIAWVVPGPEPNNLQASGEQYFNDLSGGIAYSEALRNQPWTNWTQSPITNGNQQIPVGGSAWQPSGSTTNGNLGNGGGAVTGPSGIDWGALEGLRPDPIGWEASTNKDFYQNQFADLRRDEAARQLREFAAATRPAPTPQPASDPWAWANLPGVKLGTGQATTSPPDWQLNSRFAWSPGTTNTQILQDINPILSQTEQQYLNKNPKALEGAPSFLDRNAFYNWTNTSHPNDKGWQSVINEIYNNVWQDQGSKASGPMVPAGYAAPI